MRSLDAQPYMCDHKNVVLLTVASVLYTCIGLHRGGNDSVNEDGD